ncbi:hypothetical protein VI817_001099 [Penicillium citrinum]|nr:hypothetical protein VI817_001099 [Penicillium citrinum]
MNCYNSRVSMSLSTPENGVRSGENRTQHDVMQSRQDWNAECPTSAIAPAGEGVVYTVRAQ